MSAPAPVPPAFFDPSAIEMNRRLQLLGDDLEVLKAQEASRMNQAVRPTAITGEMATQTMPRSLPPIPTDMKDNLRQTYGRLQQQLDSNIRDADMQTSKIRELKKEMFMADLRSPFGKVAPMEQQERHIKTDVATSPISQSPRYAVEEKGKQKEIVDRIRERQQMPLGITVPVDLTDITDAEREQINRGRNVPQTMSAEQMSQGFEKLRQLREQGIIPLRPKL
jgi:hypothetical protein